MFYLCRRRDGLLDHVDIVFGEGDAVLGHGAVGIEVGIDADGIEVIDSFVAHFAEDLAVERETAVLCKFILDVVSKKALNELAADSDIYGVGRYGDCNACACNWTAAVGCRNA